MKYLITGRNGQLAREFICRFEQETVSYHAPGESLLDITDQKAVNEAVSGYKPDVIINCAAYNLVDKAEEDEQAAFSVNAAGPQNLARAAAKHNAMMVHFGSDYVFDGLKENGLYTEHDPVNPVNIYGKSKLLGEQHVRTECERHLLLRLSWVFGPGQQNFIFKLRSWARDNEYLKIACDEFSVPTYTRTVVDSTLSAVREGMTGRYHLTSSGFCSRYEWAQFVLKNLAINKFIRPVSMDSFGLRANRPKFSAMNSELISNMLNLRIPAWQDAVGSFLRESA